MGTSIDCIFAHDGIKTPVELQKRLDEMCAALRSDLDRISVCGRFSKTGGSWRVVEQLDDDDKSVSLLGEGPYGLGIQVYRHVICLSSLERFPALWDEQFGASLRRALCSLTISLANPSRIAVAAAGFGDTDAANDVAHEGGPFEQVCQQLTKVIGEPATSWDQLGAGVLGWYLGPPIPLA